MVQFHKIEGTRAVYAATINGHEVRIIGRRMGCAPMEWDVAIDNDLSTCSFNYLRDAKDSAERWAMNMPSEVES